jgi:hypothetical protein
MSSKRIEINTKASTSDVKKASHSILANPPLNLLLYFTDGSSFAYEFQSQK